jgi:hypothetical protein
MVVAFHVGGVEPVYVPAAAQIDDARAKDRMIRLFGSK